MFGYVRVCGSVSYLVSSFGTRPISVSCLLVSYLLITVATHVLYNICTESYGVLSPNQLYQFFPHSSNPRVLSTSGPAQTNRIYSIVKSNRVSRGSGVSQQPVP
ncbi:hypothetical protein DL93DRAFT_543113 [Clavulina sp. PMI_390]|nr:hypothetical protein DL93DRAFT_543113 [Clavulina sp. PMI_390]